MTEKHKLNSFPRAVNLALTDPAELEDLLASKAYQSRDKKGSINDFYAVCGRCKRSAFKVER